MRSIPFSDIDETAEKTEQEGLLELKKRKLEQAAMRLEQKERHLKIQEEKTKLLEEKRRLEEIEKRRRRLKKVFSAFLKGIGTVAAVGTSIVGLLSYLRQEAQYSPEAARAYRGIINTLEQMLSSVRHGGSLAKRIFLGVFDKILFATKKLFEIAKGKFIKSKKIHDDRSKIIQHYIKRDISIKLGGKKRMRTDSSVYRFNKYDAAASNYVNRAIRIYDKRHNDIVGILAVSSLSKAVIIPILLSILKASAITGIGGAITGPLKENITDPIIKRIIGNLKLAASNKGADETYLQAIGKKVSEDMTKLLGILKKEKAFVANKLESSWNRIKGMFNK